MSADKRRSDKRITDAIQAIGVIRPGDTLVLTTERMLTHEQAAAIKRAFEDEAPGVRVIVVAGMTATVQRP